MRKTLLLLVVLALVPWPAVAENVAQDEVSFRITFANPDGQGQRTDQYVVRYTAVLNHSRHEQGGPAKPFEGKYIDDRRCVQKIDSYVARNVYYDHPVKSTLELDRKKYRKMVQSSTTKSAAPVIDRLWRGENCNEARSKMDQQVRDARRQLLAVFPTLVREDRDQVIDDLATDYKTEVVVEETE